MFKKRTIIIERGGSRSWLNIPIRFHMYSCQIPTKIFHQESLSSLQFFKIDNFNYKNIPELYNPNLSAINF